MLRASSLPRQAASASGSSRIAAILADLMFAAIAKRNFPAFPAILLNRPQEKWNSHLGYRARGSGALQTAPNHGHWGSNGAWVGSGTRRRGGGNGGSDRARGSSLAALGVGGVLDRE